MSFFEAMFGDDFPGAFANGDGRSCKSMKTLLDLPTEIWEITSHYLSGLDIKQLRLTSSELAEKVALRIDRVYISPNRANLDRLKVILDHPQYRLRVQEIVWDDAQLLDYPTIESFRAALTSDRRKARAALEGHLHTLVENADYKLIDMKDCTQEDGRLSNFGKAILLSSDSQISKDLIAANAPTMSVEESYDLYQKLFQDEKEIIKRGWDVTGLQRALAGFPQLKRITLTSEVWKSSWSSPTPTHVTPFFRALPSGFQKPSVSSWIQPVAVPAPAQELREMFSQQHVPAEWRGYGIIMASLAANPVPHLEAFVVDAGTETMRFSPPFLHYVGS